MEVSSSSTTGRGGCNQSVMTDRVLLCLALAMGLVCVHGQSLELVGVKAAFKVYDECSKAEGFTTCLKQKAVTYLDRLSRMEKLSLADGVAIIRNGDGPPQPLLTEQELVKILPRSLEAKDETLTQMLFDKVASYFDSRTFQVTLPKVSGRDISRGIEEGRGKMKKMMGMMMMGAMGKMASFIPMAIAFLFVLAGKALIISKIALLIAGIIALKKLIQNKNSGGHGGGGHGGGWQSGGGGGGWPSGGGGGGWDKRSYDEAQKLAYKSYVPKQ